MTRNETTAAVNARLSRVEKAAIALAAAEDATCSLLAHLDAGRAVSRVSDSDLDNLIQNAAAYVVGEGRAAGIADSAHAAILARTRVVGRDLIRRQPAYLRERTRYTNIRAALR